ncbi:hypothetical protein [Streptomyces sp. VB1]|uniref:hypothetical protein n=1 Tax=Streptomyces sp. VB1 TaxID=2986803 RepID=UPI0022429F39|nr:hypothetical protein [Streptomyces sp. VB1]UZI26680.1 hypothetical protein OH133_00315 [Streptomyces sp. VB1]
MPGLPSPSRTAATRGPDGHTDHAILTALLREYGYTHRSLADEVGIDDDEDRAMLLRLTSAADVGAAVKERSKELKEGKKTARAKVLDKVPSALVKYKLFLEDDMDDDQLQSLIGLIPKFFYFSTYELLPGECDLHSLAERRKAGKRYRGDGTILSLLRLAGEGPEDFLDGTTSAARQSSRPPAWN